MTEVEVGHPSEVDEIFDNISYNKGASVIRMLFEWIGEDAFRKGMKAYLDKYSYSNALTEQLWQSLEEASDFFFAKRLVAMYVMFLFPYRPVVSPLVP